MKGIEKIADKILADADEKAIDILKAARASAEETTGRAEEQARESLEQAKASLAARREEILQRGRRTAALESKKRVLAAKQQVIDSAYAKALDQLLHLKTPDYIMLLTKLCCAAVEQNGGGELMLNEKDQEAAPEILRLVKAQTGKQLTLAKETAEIPGGFILRQGAVEINCALDVMMRLLEGGTAHEVAALLF
ncbi:V-type ATP synthase subunit E [Acidaminobacterium chupaoyuni]